MHDMAVRGRARGKGASGEANGCSKLTAADIPIIRQSKQTQRSLAEQFGVNQSVISEIKTHKAWKHVP